MTTIMLDQMGAAQLRRTMMKLQTAKPTNDIERENNRKDIRDIFHMLHCIDKTPGVVSYFEYCSRIRKQAI